MVFDVESVGLYGEGFSVGFVVVDREGRELATGSMGCPPGEAYGQVDGRDWVAQHIPEPRQGYGYSCPAEVRDAFWRCWQEHRAKGAVLVADCAWPVEASFLNDCIDDNPKERMWHGPYPLHDVASVRLAAGLDPLATEGRRPEELPAHDPVADARQSARLLIEALALCRHQAAPAGATP